MTRDEAKALAAKAMEGFYSRETAAEWFGQLAGAAGVGRFPQELTLHELGKASARLVCNSNAGSPDENIAEFKRGLETVGEDGGYGPSRLRELFEAIAADGMAGHFPDEPTPFEFGRAIMSAMVPVAEDWKTKAQQVIAGVDEQRAWKPKSPEELERRTNES